MILEKNLKNTFLVSSFLLIITIITGGRGFSQVNETGMTTMLTKIGFENVRLKAVKDSLFLTYESNNYRWDVRGLKVFLDSVVNNIDAPTQLEVITLSNEIPAFQTSVYSEDWKRFRTDSITKEEFHDKLTLTYKTDRVWQVLKSVEGKNPDLYKFDLVIYPLFSYTNITFAKIYEVMFALAPALEFSLWKGNKFVLQVIFPIYADTMVYSDSYRSIRPGFVTIAQKVRIPGPLFTTFTAGIFSQNKWGIDVDLLYPFKNQHWSVGMNIGYTARAYFSEGIQYLRLDPYLNYLARISYFYSPFNLQIDLTGGKYIYGDYGVRLDVTRHFGETSIGFYAIYAGGKPNGGFHMSIPLPPSKRSRRHYLRVLPPRYYDIQYNGATEYIKGHTYSTNPANSRSEDYFNLLYIKNSLH